MGTDPDEGARREAVARAAIKRAFDADDEDSGVALFISHHLEELASDYWTRHFSTGAPEPRRILDALVLQGRWGGEDEIGTFDFTLPGDVTNYLISVRFDERGEVSDVSMES